MDRDLDLSESIKMQKKKQKKQGKNPAILTKQAWYIKVLLYGQKITPKNSIFAVTKQAIPSGQDRPILPARVANQNTRFTSSCLLAEPTI